MKLLRHGPLGAEKPGALDSQGRARDLSLLVPDFTPEWLTPAKLQALAAIDLHRMPLVPEGTRLGAPLAGVRQFLAVGLNYRKHAQESGMDIPKEPVVFNKALGTIAGPNDDVPLAKDSLASDWEVELAFVIGTRASQVSVGDALKHVAGYCLCNDISERDWQLKRNGQWVKGKSFDGYGPIGPYLVTSDEIANPQALPLSLALNGQTRQSSNTSDMIFSVAEIVAYMSQYMTLMPGDLITTGTPEGVGMGVKPTPQYLKRSDVMALDGGVLGTQKQTVV